VNDLEIDSSQGGDSDGTLCADLVVGTMPLLASRLREGWCNELQRAQ
jgi:hypothetical protein